MNARAKILLATKLLLSVGLLALVLSKVDPQSVFLVLAKADPLLVALWYSLIPVVACLAAWRWEILAPGLSYGTALKYTWIGIFYGHVLPGAIAGDVAKGVSLAFKDSAARVGLAASIVAEKVIGLAALLLFFDVACAVVYRLDGDSFKELRNLAVIALVLSLVGAIAGAIAIVLAVRLRDRVVNIRSGVASRLAYGVVAAVNFYSSRPILLLKAFGISMAIHVVNIFAVYLSLLALRVDADILFAAVVYPSVSVMLLIPISISGIGVRDATLAVLFSLFGLPLASGVALSWLALFSTIPNVMIGGAIQLWEMYRKR